MKNRYREDWNDMTRVESTNTNINVEKSAEEIG